jgi:hypothetical protein
MGRLVTADPHGQEGLETDWKQLTMQLHRQRKHRLLVIVQSADLTVFYDRPSHPRRENFTEPPDLHTKTTTAATRAAHISMIILKYKK